MGNNNDHNNNKYFYKVECPNSPDPYPKIEQQTFGSFQKELFKKNTKNLMQLICLNSYQGSSSVQYTNWEKYLWHNNNVMPYLCWILQVNDEAWFLKFMLRRKIVSGSQHPNLEASLKDK